MKFLNINHTTILPIIYYYLINWFIVSINGCSLKNIRSVQKVKSFTWSCWGGRWSSWRRRRGAAQLWRWRKMMLVWPVRSSRSVWIDCRRSWAPYASPTPSWKPSCPTPMSSRYRDEAWPTDPHQKESFQHKIPNKDHFFI